MSFQNNLLTIKAPRCSFVKVVVVISTNKYSHSLAYRENSC